MKAKMIVVAVLVVVGLCFPAWALDGIVSHWKFDEGSGNIAYDSAGTNDGTIYGATWTMGKIGGALSFDGVDDYVDVIDSDDSLDIEDNITITAWVKLDYFNLHDHDFIVGKQPTGTSRTNYPGNYIFRTTPLNGYLHLHHQTGTGDHEISKYSSTYGITAGEWQHCSVTLVEGGNVNFYIDGSPAGTVPQLGAFGLLNDEPVRIGTRKDAWSYFHGLLDEITIFNRALSGQEILEIYYTGMGDTDWTIGVPVMEVNTEYAEWDPFLSADGLSLYYSKGKTNTFYFHRLYQATRQEPFGPFTSIKEISELNYSGGHIQDPWVSQDNLRLYYMRTEPGNYWRLKFSERASVNDPWPVGVNISELNVLNQMLRSPTLTADELTIFFSSFPTNPIPGGEGGDDIWMATRPDRYSPFDNITNQIGINTADNEGGPSVSPDGLTLVFDSHRNGPSQLFKATRESLTQPFGNIEHLWACDTPGGSSATPCLSSDGSAIYYRSHTATRSTDIFVSYLVEKGPYEIAITGIKDAIAKKLDALEQIEVALEKEWTAYDALEQLLDNEDYSVLKKGDIITAMQKIHSSIQHQQQSIDSLQKSIEKLQDSLSVMDYEPPPPPLNKPPSVNITWPQNGTVFTPDQTVGIEASASDIDGSVVMVEFFADGSKIAEDVDGSDGWKASWYNHTLGDHSLTARATDNEGAATTSQEVVITVSEEPPPPPPPPPPIPPPPPPP
ncbi:MAG: hypothetical protein GWN67_27470 [Phycisphaerae bacterium]|nr:hypothetical protein [Phycisphaerae bacterium]NIP56048.1 hypothetical protein [Phycisphaerae bacterium]NIS50318.1 hypothetical protein [Phycisphaerae bacterium]NIU08065.1 hypothetical protein [Phycisphaerae bacterium]NIU59964.1 hypothetical protein [Phycisphaerae bacterium]